MKRPRKLVTRGALAGILGATAIAVWFLILDSVQGMPLYTPAFIASSLFGLEGVQYHTGAILLFTLIHYAAFIVVGIFAAWIAKQVEVIPGVLLGVALGFLLFDIVFYGSIVLTGADVIGEFGWPVVLTGNIIAGIVLFETLRVFAGRKAIGWSEVLSHHHTIREGLTTGLIGAVLVALWFLGADLISGRPAFFTPAALGSAVMFGANEPGAVQITLLTVIGYSVIHFAAFLITGIVAAAIFSAAEDRFEVVMIGGILLFVVFEVFSIGIIAILVSWLFRTLSWWNIVIANLLAAGGMGAYLARQHPTVMQDLRNRPLEEELADERGSRDPTPHHTKPQ